MMNSNATRCCPLDRAGGSGGRPRPAPAALYSGSRRRDPKERRREQWEPGRRPLGNRSRWAAEGSVLGAGVCRGWRGAEGARAEGCSRHSSYQADRASPDTTETHRRSTSGIHRTSSESGKARTFALVMDWKHDPVGMSRLMAMIVEERETPGQMIKRPSVVVHYVSSHDRPPHQRSCLNSCHPKHVLAGLVPRFEPCANFVLVPIEGLHDLVGEDQAMLLRPFPLLPPGVTRDAHCCSQ